MSDGYRPLGDRLIVVKDELVTQMKGGIVISDDEAKRDRKPRGLVTHAGEGVKALKVGDYVMYHEYAGSKIDIEEGRDHVVIEEKDALVVLPRPEGV